MIPVVPGGAVGVFLALVTGTFVSEDLACIAAGLLIRDQLAHPATALTACFLGIYLGDAGVWLMGRLAGRVARGPLGGAARLGLGPARLARATELLDRHMPLAILASRFVPGTRVPVCFAAGALGRRTTLFFAVTLVAVAIWTPLIVIGAWRGAALFPTASGWIWPGAIVAVLLARVAVPAARLAGTRVGRARLAARVQRLWRWEFWPPWVFYAPVAAWVGLLALRYRGLWPIAAANPGIRSGGIVGESKHEILGRLPARRVVPFALIDPGQAADRLERLRSVMTEKAWSFPIVLKPDSGERGAGVRIVAGEEEARVYLDTYAPPVLAQRWHPGPYEAGVFYYRFPGESRGRIFSITDKVFPEVTGDGRSTLEDLIWLHPRYRMQARTFLARHRLGATRVPEAGERVVLARAGNHVQGTMFKDGSGLLADGLERAVDETARGFDGFHFGRFDVRYESPEAFRRGEFGIVELNGATSESTDLYDPSGSLLRAYRILFRQWSLLFAIGAAHRDAAHAPRATARQLLRTVLSHYRAPRPDPIAD